VRANGTRTPIELDIELGRIDSQLIAVGAALSALTAKIEWLAIQGGLADATEVAWNALHDAVTALEAERRVVELNAPHADATALLVHQNID
jgi:hypothetical protein